MRGEPRSFLVLAVTLALAAPIVGCGVLSAGDDLVLRAAATVDYHSQDSTLVFRPGDLEFGTDVWGSHTVEFEITTDDWIQRVSLHDRYVTYGSELVPAEGADRHEYTLSDQGPFGGVFDVEVGELAEGDHPVSLSVPVSLEPSPAVGDALEPRDLTLAIDLVYHVWQEPPNIDPGLPTVEEVDDVDIEDAQDLNAFLGCAGVTSFHHASVDDASDALSLASSHVRDMAEMGGHGELVEAIPLRQSEHGREDLWAIVDSNGYVIGSVEKGQAMFLCENKPPYYEAPDVGTPFPPCEGPDERLDPDCET